MPRSNHQLALTSTRSPVIPAGSMSTSPSSAAPVASFSSYVGHLDAAGAAAAAAGNGQWDDSAGWSHRYPAFTF